MKIIDRHNFFWYCMCSLHNTFSWQDYIGGYCTGYFWKLSGKSFSNVFFIIGGNICAFSALPVSRISLVTLYCGAICSVGCISNAGYMAFWAFSSIAWRCLQRYVLVFHSSIFDRGSCILYFIIPWCKTCKPEFKKNKGEWRT